MKNLKLLILGLFATAAVAVVPTANAQPAVHYLASGATSAFQQFGVSVVNDNNPDIHGWGLHPPLHDQRHLRRQHRTRNALCWRG